MAFKTAEGNWRALVRVNGRRLSRTFRLKVRAEDWERSVKDGEPIATVKRNVPTLAEFYETWVRDFGQVELADSTLKSVGQLAIKQLLPRVRNIPMNAICREDCLRIRAELGRELSAAYANNVLNIARRLFKIAVQNRVIVENPWTGIKRLKVPPRQVSYWTIEERDTALAYLAGHDPDFGELVTVAVHTGLRWGELYALDRGAIDLRQALLTICANYRPSVKRKVPQTKTGRIETVPLNKAAWQVLSSRAAWPTDKPVFDPKLLEAARYRMAAVAKATGVRLIRFHDLRHTFASNLREAGVDISTVQELMRHRSIAMTMIYAHIGAKNLSSAAEKLCGTGMAPEAPKSPSRKSKPLVLPSGNGHGPIVKWRPSKAS